jgi:hypothetical protein
VNRNLLAVVAVGALTFSVYLLTGGDVPAQLNWLVDAGASVTHAAECPVRLSDDCLDAGRQAGFTLHKYERLRFPVWVRVQSDGGRDVQLPPMNTGLAGACIEVVAWTDCSLDATAPARASVSALLGQQLPFTPVGAVKQWGRAKFDAGLDCPLADGGSYGDRNVMPRAWMLDPDRCELVGSGVVMMGADPEQEL